MKKSFFSVLSLFLTTFCFAIDDINLYSSDGECLQIRNNKVYVDDKLTGTIEYSYFIPVEDDNSDIIKISEDNNSVSFSVIIISLRFRHGGEKITNLC